MKIFIALSSITVLFLSASFADFNNDVTNNTANQFNSVRNLPVIIENETLSNDRCRLHLDNGTKLDVYCKHTAERFDG